MNCASCGALMSLNAIHQCQRVDRGQIVHNGYSTIASQPWMTNRAVVATNTTCSMCWSLPCLCATGFKWLTKGCPDCQGEEVSRACQCSTATGSCSECGWPQFFGMSDKDCICKIMSRSTAYTADFITAFRTAIRKRRALWHDIHKTGYTWCDCVRCKQNQPKPVNLVERALSCPTCQRFFCKVKVDATVGPIDVVCEGCLREGR